MTLHLDQPRDRTSTAEPAKTRFNDIKMLDLIRVRPEVLLTPPG